MTVGERWLPVPGYEGYYEVSDYGSVRSVDRLVRHSERNPDKGSRRIRGRILKPYLSPRRGYPTVALSRSNVLRTHTVHRLVLAAFVGPCPPGMDGCHHNDIAADNRLSNLRWDTKRANQLDSIRNGGHPSTRGTSDTRRRRTQCAKGHPFTPENTYSRREGWLECLICICDRNRAAYLRRKEAKVSA